uniref:CUE domain-containing protein n=1 Tax=Caenorhabditis japonica TaxID=281687 RepID=A0A8R1DIU3_CAEJA
MSSVDPTSSGATSTSSEFRIEDLFHQKRIGDTTTHIFSVIYAPIALIVLIIRLFIGFHAVVVACILRKSAALRLNVLRIMCYVLGIVVEKSGERDETARVLCANHVSILDHLAIDILTPCLLPSVWDIPAFIRWCFGYVDLGAARGREQLVNGAKKLIAKEQMPLLAFPEGVITSGEKALLKFNTWSFEIAPVVQPVAVRVWRPNPWKVAVSVLGATWWIDLFYFFALPFTVISVEYLPIMERNEEESLEEFTGRVAEQIAGNLKISVSKFGVSDAAEAVKRMKTDREQAKRMMVKEKSTPLLVDARQLDECAMRIKQSFPTFHLSAIRKDLEKTRSQNTTLANLKAGKIANSQINDSGKITLDASSWRGVFENRKWQMIENNRQKYMNRDA